MPSARSCWLLALVAGSTACTALLGATDVPDPQSGSGLDATASPDAQHDTGAFEAGRADGDGALSSGSSGSSASSSGSSGSASGGPDSGGGDDSGCGPLGTTSNCGVCGVVCSGTNAASTTCNQASCSYTCASGWGDCNAGTAPDTDGCETPTTTAQNCGACGVACDVTTGVPSCVGRACTYACNQGHLDCNAVNGPNTDGCECTTPACCGTSCQTTHDDGLGQTYYDCNPQGTYNEQTAHEACAAYAMSIQGDPNACTGGWNCRMTDTQSECYAPMGSGTRCWNYSGSDAGNVTDFTCPGNKTSTWN